MSTFNKVELDKFHEAAQTMKLYRRAELEDASGAPIIEQLYVDPLPNDHVLQTMLRANTTFLIGRKGTGKSTVFQRSIRAISKDKKIMSAYVDIKTVFESAQVDNGTAEKIKAKDNSLSLESIRQLLLMRSFLREIVSGLTEDIRDQLRSSWSSRFKNAFSGSTTEILDELTQFLHDVDQAEFVDIGGLRDSRITLENTGEVSTNQKFGVNATAGKDPKVGIDLEDSEVFKAASKAGSEFSSILLRTIDVKALILRLREILAPLKVRHLVVFIDDFSELPQVAMQSVVDVLLAPLNNWSNELIKFKIAAYPGRIYYGAIDKTKVDEINLDMYQLYGQKSVGEMEAKAIEFTQRLVEARFRYFGLNFTDYVEQRADYSIWRLLFFASLGNPRTLGYILFFLYDTQLIYDKTINARSIREAARRFYEEKIEAYFTIGRFLHESFDERSTIFSLKELLETIVNRARKLRSHDRSIQINSVRGRPPTSHFHVSQNFDSLLSTLELNFFLSKYYVMSDRDGHRVSVYALNYGLCQKYTLEFGRPEDTRQSRLYFVERIFDYSAIMLDYVRSNQEIRCDNSICDKTFDSSTLDALRMFHMQCPECKIGVCHVTNISRKYENLIRSVDDQALLPSTELGILHTLEVESRSMFAGEIAAELDCSSQLVGVRGKRLAERDLITRKLINNRRELAATELAQRVYFSDTSAADLNIADGDDG